MLAYRQSKEPDVLWEQFEYLMRHLLLCQRSICDDCNRVQLLRLVLLAPFKDLDKGTR